jgi:hypothetical protein
MICSAESSQNKLATCALVVADAVLFHQRQEVRGV